MPAARARLTWVAASSSMWPVPWLTLMMAAFMPHVASAFQWATGRPSTFRVEPP